VKEKKGGEGQRREGSSKEEAGGTRPGLVAGRHGRGMEGERQRHTHNTHTERERETPR